MDHGSSARGAGLALCLVSFGVWVAVHSMNNIVVSLSCLRFNHSLQVNIQSLRAGFNCRSSLSDYMIVEERSSNGRDFMRPLFEPLSLMRLKKSPE